MIIGNLILTLFLGDLYFLFVILLFFDEFVILFLDLSQILALILVFLGKILKLADDLMLKLRSLEHLLLHLRNPLKSHIKLLF